MSRLTLELLNDPELTRIAEQAYHEVRTEAEAQGRRYKREEVADRINQLSDWRARALRAEALLPPSPPPTTEVTPAPSSIPPDHKPS